MSKHEILIVTDNNDVATALFKWLEKQPKDETKSTTITILEDGTKEVLDHLLHGLDAIAIKRKQRNKALIKQLQNIDENVDYGQQEHPEDFNL